MWDAARMRLVPVRFSTGCGLILCVRFLVCRRAQSRAVEAGLEAGDNVTALVHPLGRLDNNDEGECQP